MPCRKFTSPLWPVRYAKVIDYTRALLSPIPACNEQYRISRNWRIIPPLHLTDASPLTCLTLVRKAALPHLQRQSPWPPWISPQKSSPVSGPKI